MLVCLFLSFILLSCLLPHCAVLLFFFNLLGLHINDTNIISELYQQMYSHTNIFFTAKLKQALMMILSMFYFLSAMNCEKCELCYQPVTTENYLLPAHTDHYALKSDFHLPKKFIFICFSESPLKLTKNAFYFILKALFHQDIKNFVIAFWLGRYGFIRRIRLTKF